MSRESPWHSDPSSTGSFSEAVPGASFDVPLVEQAKNDIRSLANEIAGLATSRLSPADFYDAFLPRVRTAMGAAAVAVWRMRDDGQLNLDAHQDLPAELHDGRTPNPSHAAILTAVLAEGQPVVAPPRRVSSAPDRPANPLSSALILVPIRIDERFEYLLEVVLTSTGGPTSQRGYLRFAAQMSDVLADYIRRWRLRETAEQRRRSELAEQCLLEVATAQVPQRAAARAADGCCQQFDADVAILLAWGMRPRVLGVSGSVQLDPRSEAAAAACELASRGPAVLKDRRWWLAEAKERRSGQPAGAGQTAGPSPQGLFDSVLQSKVDRLANTLRLRCILMIRSAEAATPWLLLGFQDRREAEAIVRGLEEGFGSRVPRGPALFLSALERLVLKIATHRPAGRLLSAGQWLQPLTGRRPWTRMLSGLVAACLVGAIACFPVAEQVPATAILTPQSKLVYYAPHSGLIERVLVTDGQQVVPGTPLVHIASRELERQSAAVDGEIEITRRKLESARWLRNRGDRLPDREVDQLESEIRQLEATLGSLTHQRQLLLEQIAELEVRAVAPGRVLTWNLAQRLTNRPVSMGHPLVATFDPAGPWQLEVSIPDYRAGIVARALETEAGALPCQVVFTSHPGKIVPAELTTMADVAMRLPNAARQPQHVIPAIAHVAPGNLPLHKDGAVARVVIDCGRTPLGWLVCRDAFWSLSSWIRMLW